MITNLKLIDEWQKKIRRQKIKKEFELIIKNFTIEQKCFNYLQIFLHATYRAKMYLRLYIYNTLKTHFNTIKHSWEIRRIFIYLFIYLSPFSFIDEANFKVVATFRHIIMPVKFWKILRISRSKIFLISYKMKKAVFFFCFFCQNLCRTIF